MQSDQTVDLKEIRDLYGRLMFLARSMGVDQKHAISNYEFTLTPDGTVLPCTDKSKFIHLLENMAPVDAPPDDDQLMITDVQDSTYMATVHLHPPVPVERL